VTAAAGRSDGRWERAVSEHRAALDAFLEFAAAVPAQAWDRPSEEGKWTPAEVTEHLALAYEAALRELEGGGAMRPRKGPFWQRLLRWFLLPHMLFYRTMPRSAAPRETRPAPTGLTQGEGITRLRELAFTAEAAWGARPDARLTHPYFGALDRSKMFRLAALHLEHHQRGASAAVMRTA
jgi:hypothetical protein